MEQNPRSEGSLTDVQPGWAVYGSDEQQVGTVRETGTDRLVVRDGSRTGQDLTIPRSAIRRIAADRVYLAVPSAAVAEQGWSPPPPVAVGDTASPTDGPPRIPESIGTPGLTGVVEEGGHLVRAGSSSEAGDLATKEQLGPVGEATGSAGAAGGATHQEVVARSATEQGPVAPVPATESIAASAPATAGEPALRLHGEELRVSKERVPVGEAQIHTRTVTEMRTMQVPVQHEELVIERAGKVTVVDAAGNVQTAPAAEPTEQSAWWQRLPPGRAVRIGLPVGVLVLILALVVWRTVVKRRR
jgi:hypothetical protein